MNKVRTILRQYTLPLAMLLGVACYRWFGCLSFLTPYLIFFMLYLTFLRVDIRQMRLRSWHWLMLAVQLLLTLGSYYLFLPIGRLLAEGIMMCFLMPTATAAAVITGKLGGSVEQLTTYTLLSSFTMSLFVPLFFSFISEQDVTILTGFLTIVKRVFPLLMLPFVLALLTRWGVRLVRIGNHFKPSQTISNHLKPFQTISNHLKRIIQWMLRNLAFYLWAFSLVILMANTTYSLVYDDYNPLTAILLAIGALIACIVQFFLGKYIGVRYARRNGADEQQLRISAGQALGQKNTVLGIWLQHAYLQPVGAIATAAYIVFQNLFNAWQLRKKV